MLAGLTGRVGLHGPKALHRNRSFASGPAALAAKCNRLSSIAPNRTSGLPPHERAYRLATTPLSHPGLATLCVFEPLFATDLLDPLRRSLPPPEGND